MHILGFNCYAHDAAAAIMRDGEFLGLVEEERFLRRKHVGDFPIHSIRWCLDHAGITPKDLDHIVYYWDPKLAQKERIMHVLKHLPRSISLVKSRWGKEAPMKHLQETLTKELGINWNRTKLHFAEHHLTHAASCFLTSEFDHAAIMTLDAAGEWDCTWMGVGKGLDMKPLKKMQFPNSIGLVYGAVTEFLGFHFASGEGKVMGLAPYGKPDAPIAAGNGKFKSYVDAFRDVIKLTPEGGYEVDLSYFEYHVKGRPNWFSQKFFDTFGPARAFNGPMNQHYMDLSAGLQQRTEEVGLHLAKWLKEQTGADALCMAGGVALNAVMNGKILMSGIFKDVVVHPAANDAGTAIGACFWLWNTVLRNPRKYVFEHAYFGPEWSDADYESAIAQTVPNDGSVTVEKNEQAPELAGRMLAEGKIISWFQGRMEMGPRALGNRSTLADPRSNEMKDLLNARVKFREGFRPFAPSVLEEKVGEWFTCDYPSPYMILVYDVRPDKMGKVPAITHVDGTGRVQAVSKKHNPRYYRLIAEFERHTGVPMVLNTSFNKRGEPIVHTPQQAIECFLQTGMDGLFLGDYVLVKKVASAARSMTQEELVAAHAQADAAEEAQT